MKTRCYISPPPQGQASTDTHKMPSRVVRRDMGPGLLSPGSLAQAALGPGLPAFILYRTLSHGQEETKGQGKLWVQAFRLQGECRS